MTPFWHEATWFFGFLLGILVLVHVVLRAYFDISPWQGLSRAIARLARRVRR